MSEGKLSIHSENILPIIKKWLYSDKEIFLRELVSNSCDALQKLRMLRDKSAVDVPDEEFRIDIQVDKEKKILSISDTGIGMSQEEVEKYIAQIAFSGAEEFLKKYESKQEIIGHFGLGFYSSYMVADQVEIQTQSYQKKDPVFWSCAGSSTYQIEKGTREKRGTEVLLHINEESSEYLELNTLRSIARKYCLFLPFPIYLNGEKINEEDPLWVKNPSDCTDEEYLSFYRTLYPLEPEPMFWVHLNVDYPFSLQGILYFPKITSRIDLSQNAIRLFCNRVYVSDHCKEILPEYLMILKGAIDSPDIPLNVSRSYLQADKTVRQLGSHIAKKITDRLTSLYKTDREKYISYWPDVETFLKLGILHDEKFYERVKEALIWKSSNGEWTTIEDYIERSGKDKIFYALDQGSPFLNLYKEKNLEVLFTNSFIDTPLINFLEGKISPKKFQRVDASLEESLLDPSKEKNLLDSEGKSEAGKIADFIRSYLPQDYEVEAKSLSSETLPALMLIDEDGRRLRDYMKMTQNSDAPFPTKKTFVVNTNSKLINAAFALQTKKPELAKELVKQVFTLSRLSQRELDPKEIDEAVTSHYALLEKFSESLLSSK